MNKLKQQVMLVLLVLPVLSCLLMVSDKFAPIFFVGALLWYLKRRNDRKVNGLPLDDPITRVINVFRYRKW